ncbi:hypothetical protein GCM10011579_028450 [Streptomyces albiflavescens]|uniref:Uncharacterized protein n=1 Tax=Streptomyces albiflavescens TaxID=1623582 RepID=A0A917Y030_9ACTN|nr:hypothetical protein GCM10011579_028450 [Streptomyces albiflavescens]
MVVTWKERSPGEVRSTLRRREDPEEQAHFSHCSDLLEDFLKTISRMENEYLQASIEGIGITSAAADGPKTQALDGSLRTRLRGSRT